MDQEERSILEEYERRPRVLTEAFLAAIPWHDVRNHPVPPSMIPVLRYMAEVERLTERFAADLRRTPTWHNPVIRRFIERWSSEEVLHGELLMRFLAEAGLPHDPAWYAKVERDLPRAYLFSSRISTPFLSRLMGGKAFEAVHMVWGTISEYSTLNGYGRLRELAAHPVLDIILGGIMAEEARHARFYWKMSHAKLARSAYSRFIARNVIERVWKPVGEGPRYRAQTREVIRVLFAGNGGVEYFDAKVTARLRRLPGFGDCTRVTDRIAETALADRH